MALLSSHTGESLTPLEIMRKSTAFLALTLLEALLVVLFVVVHPILTKERHQGISAERRQLVQSLHLTDLCLFTEARYTRHLSQADLHSAFQDSPMAFEHFPSGSHVLPNLLLRNKDVP